MSTILALTLAGFTPAVALPQEDGLAPDASAPLSSVVAVNGRLTGSTIPESVEVLVEAHATGTLPQNARFPLPNGTDDSVRSIAGLKHQTLIKWLDLITDQAGPLAPRFGANSDYVAYFGDGWDSDWNGDVVGSSPVGNGSDSAGYLWVNHEYVSNSMPTFTSAPTGQHATLAKFLFDGGVLSTSPDSQIWSAEEIELYLSVYKRQVGGSWVRIERDATTGEWALIPDIGNRRFDATSSTRLSITGLPLGAQAFAQDHDDEGRSYGQGVVTGILGDCSGGQTPWGTVITAEENVQFYYGDLETAWTSQQAFVPGNGFDPGSNVCPTTAPTRFSEFGRSEFVQSRHDRDVYGYLVEIDPTVDEGTPYSSIASPGGDGLGHRKIGSMGRARWENCTFAVGADGRLVDGQPVVIYGGNDRRSGRIYKWVSAGVYTEGMTRGEVRQLLDDGSVYVAHFAGLENATGVNLASTGLPPTAEAPGQGRWIRLSIDSTDIAPNADAIAPGTTAGDALQDVDYNGIGGFPTNEDILRSLFTASTKLGVMELNRPEDLEWNANDPSGTPTLYVAFTKHGRQIALDDNGVLFPPDQHAALSPVRPDATGSIFAMVEANAQNPAVSTAFTYSAPWVGTQGTGAFDAANPDNLMVDSRGNLWFGTDGNFGTNGTADGLYFLDLDPSHKAGQPGVVQPSYGLPFRVVAGPSDSESTGPALSADERTLFFVVQHPGENFGSNPSTWPQDR